jgi:hypothetical protein
MATWILAVYLTSAQGSFVMGFESERACVQELRKLAHNYETTKNKDLEAISCTPTEE